MAQKKIYIIGERTHMLSIQGSGMSGVTNRGEVGSTIILHFTTALHSIFLSLSLVDFSHEDFLSLASLELMIIFKENFFEILEIEKTV